MARRGRPKKHGMDELILTVLVLETYKESRKTELKHSSAVTKAVEDVRKFLRQLSGHPVCVSETAVKRILAQSQPKMFSEALIVSRIPDSELRKNLAIYEAIADQAEIQGYPEYWKNKLRELAAVAARMKEGFSLRYGPRPEYPRINAIAH